MTDHEMFSREWYNEYFRRADTSAVHSQFCTQVYGRDLCQHGLMHIDELDLLISMIPIDSHILEIGCGNGYITEYIFEHTKSTILGLDFSDVAIEQAQKRTTLRADSLCFQCVDLTKDPIPGNDYDFILLIDSIYFLGEMEQVLPRLCSKLNMSGKLIVSIFQVREEDDPETVLRPDGTWLAQTLTHQGFNYSWHDFTEDVISHGPKNFAMAEALKSSFFAEGNQFLYQARMAENRYFKEAAEQGRMVRYMYVVEK